MNPIEPSSSSRQNPFPLEAFTQAHIRSALNYLKEHKELRSALSKKDFTILKNCKELSPLFQEVFNLTTKTHSIFQRTFESRTMDSYDQILELRLDRWANLSENGQRAKPRILDFWQNSSQNWLSLSSLSLTSLPDIWEHSAFTSRLRELNLSSNRLTSLPDSLGNLFLQTLNLDSNPSFTNLPEWIFQLTPNCRTDLQRCGFSTHVVEQALSRMNTSWYTGPRITFSIREASASSKSVNELLSELFRTAKTDRFSLPVEWDSNESLRNWLNRLSSMADYNAGGGAKRMALANKVLSFLKLAIDLNSAS